MTDAPKQAPFLVNEHAGMRVDYSGMLKQAQNGLSREPAQAEMLRQLGDHLRELGDRYYAGDVAVVDEFLQLYCISIDGRRAALSASTTKADIPAPAAMSPTGPCADCDVTGGCPEYCWCTPKAEPVPPTEQPVKWWNGIRRPDLRDGTGPSFSDTENTSHDIPLYAGVNPCNVPAAPAPKTEPATGDVWIKHDYDLRYVSRVLQSGSAMTPADQDEAIKIIHGLRTTARASYASAQPLSAAVPAAPAPLTERQIKQGWEAENVTTNPFCTNLKAWTRAVRWTEHQLASVASQEAQK